MEGIKSLLFEDPLYLYIALAFAELALVAVWHSRRTRRLALFLAVPLLVGGLVFAIEGLVVTDREQITAAARDIARCIQDGTYTGIPPHLDEQFRVDMRGIPPINRVLDKPAVEVACRAVEAARNIQRIKFNQVRVEITGDRAKMHINTMIISGDKGEHRSPVIWDLHWVRIDGRWLIREVEKPRVSVEM